MNNETLTNIINNIMPWWNTFYVFGLLIGFFYVVKSLVEFGSSGKRGGQAGPSSYIMTFVGGLLLLNTYGFLDVATQTVFLTNSSTGLNEVGLSSSGTGGNEKFALYLKLSYMLVMMVGLYGYIKGAMLFSAAGKQGEKTGPAIAHLVGGSLAINIDKVILSLGAMLGGGFQSTVNSVFS